MNRENKMSVRRWAGMLGVAALVTLVGATLLLAPCVRAEDDAGTPQAGRAVRLSSVEGEVHLSLGNQSLADQALVNTPLFEGTRVDTGNDGRAEIQFEDGSVARISPLSSLTLTVLRGVSAGENRDAEILLNSGLGYFELQGDSDSNHIRVRFGEDNVITASGFTVLRVDLDKAPGDVAVFSGNAHIEGSGVPALDLHGGESVALNASDPNSYSLAESIEPNSWDAWNSDRDQELSTEAAGRTEANNNLPDNKNPAWNDLDANGNWYNVPDQGYVWSPYEASNPGWDPYGTGYWMNTPGYGYFWISGEPWGYMPYSCGAWNYYSSFGWGWAPGGCNPWWGGGGWGFNIGFAPPRYRYPVRPRPRNPRPMDGREGRALPVISVNRHTPPGNTVLAPRDRTGTVLLGGHPVNPLRPVGPSRVPYNHSVQAFGGRLGSRTATPVAARPGYVVEPGGTTPRPVEIPATRPGSLYTSRPVGGSYIPPPATPPPAARPSGGSFSRPSAPSHSPGMSPAPSHPVGGGGGHFSGGGGGGHPSGGGGHAGGGGGGGGGSHGGGGGGHH